MEIIDGATLFSYLRAVALLHPLEINWILIFNSVNLNCTHGALQP